MTRGGDKYLEKQWILIEINIIFFYIDRGENPFFLVIYFIMLNYANLSEIFYNGIHRNL